MPRDVELGEGYEGDVMVTQVHPGQHVGHYTVQDGSSSLLQPEEDGGLGHPRRRHHHHGGGWGRGGGWGPGYYEPLYIEDITARRPFILDDDSDEAKAKRLEVKLRLKKLEEEAKAKGIKGMGGLGAAEVTECMNRIVSAAAVGAREAIRGIETGVLKNLNDVCAHIRRRVCAEVQSHHVMYHKAVSEAIKTAFAEARPHVEKLLAGAGSGRGVSGFGDLKSDIASAIASKELDQLMSAVRRVQDALIEAINSRNGTLANYQKATALYGEARSLYADSDTGNMEAAMKAQDASILGVQYFARQVQTLAELQVVFGQISSALMSAGLSNDANAVNQTLAQVNRFVIETDQRFSGVPEYKDTKFAIISAFNAELSSANIRFSDYGNPGWFQAYMNAVERVIPLPKGAGGMSGLRGLSGLGNPMAPALVALIVLVSGVVAMVAVIKGINKLAEVFNSKAETARQVILQRETDWAKIESEMRAQGKSQDEISAARESWQRGTKKVVDDIPESPSVGGAVGTVAAILLAAGIGLKVAGVI